MPSWYNHINWLNTMLYIIHSKLNFNSIELCIIQWIIPQKNSFPSVPIAALCLYNIQRENLILKILTVRVYQFGFEISAANAVKHFVERVELNKIPLHIQYLVNQNSNINSKKIQYQTAKHFPHRKIFNTISNIST